MDDYHYKNGYKILIEERLGRKVKEVHVTGFKEGLDKTLFDYAVLEDGHIVTQTWSGKFRIKPPIDKKKVERNEKILISILVIAYFVFLFYYASVKLQ